MFHDELTVDVVAARSLGAASTRRTKADDADGNATRNGGRREQIEKRKSLPVDTNGDIETLQSNGDHTSSGVRVGRAGGLDVTT